MSVEVADGIEILGTDFIAGIRTKECPDCGMQAMSIDDGGCVSATHGSVRMIWWCKCGYRERGETLAMPAEAVARWGLEGKTVLLYMVGLPDPKRADREVRQPVWEMVNQ